MAVVGNVTGSKTLVPLSTSKQLIRLPLNFTPYKDFWPNKSSILWLSLGMLQEVKRWSLYLPVNNSSVPRSTPLCATLTFNGKEAVHGNSALHGWLLSLPLGANLPQGNREVLPANSINQAVLHVKIGRHTRHRFLPTASIRLSFT